MSYTLVLEWMPGDLYMSAVTARCTAPTSSYSVVWLPPNKVYQITLYCGSTSLVSFLVGAFRGKAWSYMSRHMSRQGAFLIYCVETYKNAKHLTGKQVAELFTRYRVWDYVYSCFEALHTTGANYIVEDIDLYIEARKPAMA